MKPAVAPKYDWKTIDQLLRRECELYQDYIKLTQEERSWITKLNPAKLEELTQKRQIITDLLLAAQDQRLAQMRQFPEGDGKRLSDLIRKYAPLKEAKVLLTLTKKLRELVEEARSEGSQYSQIIGFSMGLVNGVVSILWNATQNVVRAYSRSGEIRESTNPTGNRASSILKRA